MKQQSDLLIKRAIYQVLVGMFMTVVFVMVCAVMIENFR